MRLEAQAKMGYYPTPKSVSIRITQYLKRTKEGLIRILDPCAGEGDALASLGKHLQAETFGIELDQERGKKAKEVLTRSLISDYQNTRISHGAFSLLYLNPPYDWGVKAGDLEKSERYERTFLRDTIPYLTNGGILLYLIPERRLDLTIARMLSYRFEKISAFRFPANEYERFRQLVIFGILKGKPGKDEETAESLKDCGKGLRSIAFLPEVPPLVYEVPLSPKREGFLFKSKEIDPEELAEEVKIHGLFSRVKEMMTPLTLAEKITPIMPLRHGHLAQILACGFMNGVVWDRDEKNPLLVKGITTKVVEHTTEEQGEVTKYIEKEKITIIINAFTRKGDLITIQ